MRLKGSTAPAWAAAVLADLDSFLRDHAACERKASASAMSFVAHYPDRRELVRACIDLACEELEHFRQVHRRMDERGLRLGPDVRNAYMARLAREFREGSHAYFLDRLLTAGIAEARGCERFGLLGAALPEGELRDFYRALARTEVRHQEVYLDLARTYFAAEDIARRLERLLDVEAQIIGSLPVRAALY